MFFAVTFAVVLLQLRPKQSCIANVPLSHDVNLLSVLLHIGCVVCIDLCVYVAQAPSHPPDQSPSHPPASVPICELGLFLMYDV